MLFSGKLINVFPALSLYKTSQVSSQQRSLCRWSVWRFRSLPNKWIWKRETVWKGWWPKAKQWKVWRWRSSTLWRKRLQGQSWSVWPPQEGRTIFLRPLLDYPISSKLYLYFLGIEFLYVCRMFAIWCSLMIFVKSLLVCLFKSLIGDCPRNWLLKNYVDAMDVEMIF